METAIWVYEKNSSRRRGKKDICQNCNEEFTQRLKGKKIYCSQKCKYESFIREVVVKCSNCGKDVRKKASKLKNSKHGFYFCDRKCKEEAQSLEGNCLEIRPSHYGTGNGIHTYREKMKKEIKLGCVCCKEKTIYLLVVHHIDGDRTHNEKDNLEVTCCNCHIKRHLKQIEGQWKYDPHFLTPRELLYKF